MGKKCKNCGWDGNQPGWILCGRCGANLDVVSQQPTAESKQPPQLQDKPVLVTPIEIDVNTKLKKKYHRGWIITGSVLGSIVAIVLMVKACPSSPPPVLNVVPTSIYFNNLKPGLLEADSRVVTISNTGSGKLTGTLTTDKNWLAVNPSEIEVGNGANQDIRILVDTMGLKYKVSDNCFLTIKTNGGDKQIPIYLTTTSVLFEDDFSNLNSGWFVASDEDAEKKYELGGYRVVLKKSQFLGGGFNQDIGQFDDFILEVDAKSMPSVKDSACAIIYRAHDTDNYYFFLVSAGYQSYQVGKFVNDVESTLIKWTESSFINTSTTNNRIKIVCQGEQMQFYVNDQYLNTITDSSFGEGYFGLGAVGGSESGSYMLPWLQSSTKADFIFENFKISVP
jgi:hypothetical protein